MLKLFFCLLSLACLLGNPTFAQTQVGDRPDSSLFANFESPQARPLAVSSDGKNLYAVNTPANSISIYSLENPQMPELTMEVPVGLEPVSVAERSKEELWVVNHVSDSISVVDLSIGAVVETIQVGDRPGDVVFAGSKKMAFVTSMTERRVAAIDPRTRKLVKSIPVFGNDPRTLLASEDGTTVWVAISRSGNQTTVVPHAIAPAPPNPTDESLPPAPRQGIIVDSKDPNWKDRLNVDLPDHDLFEIDVADLKVRRRYQSVGTILFNFAQRPGTHELWVANTHARNLVRFEPELKGHAIDSQITRITTGSTPKITVSDLNLDIDYAKLPNFEAISTALSQPTDIVFDRTGETAYVAAFGTDQIGVLDVRGAVTARIGIGDAEPRTKRGPRALVQHPDQDLLYVLNRLSNSVSVIDTVKQQVLTEIEMFDPTPEFIKEGRGYLFDAKLSGNGTMSCASCHIDADRDGLAWDLGDPGGKLFSNGSTTPLHPMKGPLLTQTLRGLNGERLFHWRADRPGLESFNGAFSSLLGGSLLDEDDLATLVKYMKSIRFSANPNRNLDDTLPSAIAKVGETIFMTKKNVGREGKTQFSCVGCHANPVGSGGFGFTGLLEQPTKVAQLRGLHERDGRKPTPAGRIRGFGYGADGSKDDLVAFLAKSHRFDALTSTEKESLEQFLFAFPTETAPIVGFSRTVTSLNADTVASNSDLQLLIAQAELGKCDLVATGFLNNRQVEFVYDKANKTFLRNRDGDESRTLPQLKNMLAQPRSVLTFMGVPQGSREHY